MTAKKNGRNRMNVEIAQHLASLRRQKGYSQEALAAELGLSRQAISKWERAESQPDTGNLIALADLYGVTLDELVRVEADIADDVRFEDAERNAQQERDEELAAQAEAAAGIAATEAAAVNAASTGAIGATGAANVAADAAVGAAEAKAAAAQAQAAAARAEAAASGAAASGTEAMSAAPGTVHGGMPGSFPIGMPGAIPGGMPGAAPNGMPGATGAAPNGMPGNAPGAAPGAHPYAGNGFQPPMPPGPSAPKPPKSPWLTFPYPLLVVVLFLLAGFLFHAWNPAWVLFLTIPFYYWIANVITNDPNYKAERNERFRQ